jgi:hypothetical protein
MAIAKFIKHDQANRGIRSVNYIANTDRKLRVPQVGDATFYSVFREHTILANDEPSKNHPRPRIGKTRRDKQPRNKT